MFIKLMLLWPCIMFLSCSYDIQTMNQMSSNKTSFLCSGNKLESNSKPNNDQNIPKTIQMKLKLNLNKISQ
jgi:hypothetical protein